ncbi:MAG: heparinase II/III family protein [Puniceicoccales bacterium]|jgi:hypothetical protein|nr:heparinase II/III family protein [Puniceicoccales bacterium]
MLRKYVWLVRAFGARWVLFRIRHALRMRLGLPRLLAPQKPWDAIPSDFDKKDGEGTPVFAQTVGNHLKSLLADTLARAPATDGRGAEPFSASPPGMESREILAGSFRLFGWHRLDTGGLPDWHRNALTGERAPASVHWSALGDFAFGDIKNIWELSRWPWAFPLAAAWLRTGDNAFAERFWELAENWIENNPPNSGPNWKCGQEASFRLFAAVTARFALDGAPATTPGRLAAWRRLVHATGERITANLDYALSQSNNHGISECVGLLTAGRLAGGVRGAKWTRLALARLRGQLDALVYPDGGFSQHSAVYHRVLLHDLAWGMIFAAGIPGNGGGAEGASPPVWLQSALARATSFLDAITSPETGMAHLHGANDGANILPIPAAPFADFRPAIHLARRVLPGGGAPGRENSRRHFPDSGILLLRRGPFSLLLRCPTRFRHRATRDMGHISLLWDGIPLLLNPGSYSYNATGRFADGFSSAFTHNTATCENADQMEKLGRFLYLPWPTGRFRQSGENTYEFANLAYVARFGATHTRRIHFPDENPAAGSPDAAKTIVIEDRFESKIPRRWRLHWLLHDDGSGQKPRAPDLPSQKADPNAFSLDIALPSPSTPGRLRFSCHIQGDFAPPPEITTVRAAPDSVRGWYSPHYQEARPALSLAIALPPTRDTTIRTLLTIPGEVPQA